MSLAKREPRSPYARYNKRPYAYSAEFLAWSQDIRDPSSDDAERAERSRKHSMKFLGFDPKAYPSGRFPRV